MYFKKFIGICLWFLLKILTLIRVAGVWQNIKYQKKFIRESHGTRAESSTHHRHKSIWTPHRMNPGWSDGVSVVGVNGPDADALVLGPGGQQSPGRFRVFGEGHAVYRLPVMLQDGERLQLPPGEDPDAPVPPRCGQDLTVVADTEVGKARIGQRHRVPGLWGSQRRGVRYV